VKEQIPLSEHSEELIFDKRLLKLEVRNSRTDIVDIAEEPVEIDIENLLKVIRHPTGLEVFINYAYEHGKPPGGISKSKCNQTNKSIWHKLMKND
jgi:hypothetical protein